MLEFEHLLVQAGSGIAQANVKQLLVLLPGGETLCVAAQDEDSHEDREALR